MNIVEIPLYSLYVSSKNVRKSEHTDEKEETDIQTLALDIQTNGLLSPLCVREDLNGMYEVFAGQRRLKALQHLEIESVPCIVYDKDTTDEEIENLSFSENNQRNAMNQKDKCAYYHRLYTQLGSVEAVAKKVHVKPETVEKYIKLKEYLNPDLLEHLDKKGILKLQMEVATQLMKVEKGEQIKVYQEIKNISSTKEKLDTLRVITDTTKKPVKPREKTVAPTPTPTIEPVIIPLVTNRPWIYNENKEKVTIPEDLWGEIIELVYDYQATH